MEPMKVEKTVDFINNRSGVRVKDFSGDVEHANWEQLSNDVRFRTWKFKEVDESLRDGALVEIMPGGRTPVQYVEGETLFCEVPQKGKLTFLSVDLEGNFSADHFDPARDNNSYMMEVRKGTIMCWFAHSDQTKPAEVLEYEEPGFKTAKLPTVEFGIEEINGHKIPDTFWQAIKNIDETRSLKDFQA